MTSLGWGRQIEIENGNSKTALSVIPSETRNRSLSFGINLALSKANVSAMNLAAFQ